jgi:hypothetical protein
MGQGAGVELGTEQGEPRAKWNTGGWLEACRGTSRAQTERERYPSISAPPLPPVSQDTSSKVTMICLYPWHASWLRIEPETSFVPCDISFREDRGTIQTHYRLPNLCRTRGGLARSWPLPVLQPSLFLPAVSHDRSVAALHYC